jgi:hypothetical protein
LSLPPGQIRKQEPITEERRNLNKRNPALNPYPEDPELTCVAIIGMVVCISFLQLHSH